MIKTYLVYQQINIRKDMDKVWKNYIKRSKRRSRQADTRERFPERTFTTTSAMLSKFDDDVIFEYHISIMDSEFNLGVLTMRTPEGVFETDFDK